ncbi:ABC transporter permease [Spirosoma knui]
MADESGTDIMFINYLKIAWRNLNRNRLYSGLNVGGLGIGLAACLLMYLYVRHEFTFDGFHKNSDRIARVTTNIKTPEAPMSIAAVPIRLADALKRDYPEVETAVRFEPLSATIRYGEKLFNQSDIYYADQGVFAVFSYPFVAGDPAQALTTPNSAVVTKAFAEKYMGRIDVIGQFFQCNKQTYRITGVMANLPSNADLKVSALLSKDFSTSTSWLGEDFPVYTFVLFRDKPNLGAFEKKLAALSQRYIQPEFKKMGAEGYSIRFQTEMLPEVHFSQGKMGDTPKGNRQYGYVFAVLAVFVFAIALLNYVNLLTSRATSRAREVGIRKANGALRGQLIGQFLLESFLLSLFSVAFAILLLVFTIPSFNTLLQLHLSVSWPEGLLMAVVAMVATTLLGGLYPAFVLSDYDSADVLRGRFGSFGQGLWLRRTITVVQFTLAVGMIAGVLVVRRQINYLQGVSLGFSTDQVLTVHLPDDSLARKSAPALANTLRQRTEISDLSLGSGLKPDAILPVGTTFFRANGKKREVTSNYFFIDERFVPLLNMKISSGRNLTNTSEADRIGAFLVNEAFVKMAGWRQAVGQDIEGFMHKGKVVGVIKNFNYRSLHNPVEPLVLVYNTLPPSNVTINIRPEHLPLVEAAWKSHYPNFPFEYSFLDASFDAQYRKDRLMMTLFNWFAVLTVLVSCLGLFGLTTYTTAQRIKEIGIRKVLGASVGSIVTLLSKDFLRLVLIAIAIASPIAWYAMNWWLQDFAYKVDVNGWLFVMAGLLAIGIAILTVSFQSIKAALMNPVKSLKTE